MEYLKTALKAKKMTQRELGRRIGCGESTISQYVNGKRSPDYETLLKIAEELDCSVDYLLRGEESNPIIINNEPMHEYPTAGSFYFRPALEEGETLMAVRRIISDLSEEDLQKVAEYVEFLKSRGEK